MAWIDLAYVQRFKDRHGHVRHYYRRAGHKRAPLPGKPGSSEFMAAYADAEARDRPLIGADHTIPKSVSALLVAYYASAEFKRLQPTTQRNYRFIFERWRATYGDLPAARIEAKHVRAMLDKMVDTPGAARNFRKRLAGLMDFAVSRDWRSDNPVRAVKSPTMPGEGFRAWTDDDIALFEKRHSEGSRARLALSLLLYTGQRRSDVPNMGRQHIRADKIHVAQFKGRNGQNPVRLAIPIHPALKAELDKVPADRLTFLLTEYGKPFTHAGFTQWFGDCARAAGLPPRSTPHGLRKAAARRLAEAGCSAHQIASITGHRTLKEVERYAASASQATLAEAAIAALSNG